MTRSLTELQFPFCSQGIGGWLGQRRPGGTGLIPQAIRSTKTPFRDGVVETEIPMLWDILAAISQATLTIVASVMVIRWQKGRREKILVTTIILLGCIGMFSSVRGTIEHWAAQNEVAATLEGTDRFAYLCVDLEDLKNRSSQIRLNVYSTGFLDVLEVKFVDSVLPTRIILTIRKASTKGSR